MTNQQNFDKVFEIESSMLDTKNEANKLHEVYHKKLESYNEQLIKIAPVIGTIIETRFCEKRKIIKYKSLSFPYFNIQILYNLYNPRKKKYDKKILFDYNMTLANIFDINNNMYTIID